MSRWLPILVLVAGCGPSRAEVREVRELAAYHYGLAYGHFMDRSKPNAGAALREVLKAVHVRPDYPEAHMLAGLIFLGRERYIDATEHFRSAIEQREGYFDAMNNLGATYLAMERWDDAIEIFNKLEGNVLYPSQGHAHNNLGWAWYKKGDLRQAKVHFRSAIPMAPELCPAYNNLGVVLIDEGRMDRAMKFLRQGIKRSSCRRYAEPWFHIGRIEERQRRVPEARKAYERCLEYAGDSALADRCRQRHETLASAGSLR